MPNLKNPESLELTSLTGVVQSNVESEDVDWVAVTLSGTRTRLSELLRDEAGLQTRWGEPNFPRCLESITAVVFLKQDGRADAGLRTKSDDTIAALIPAGEDYYIPAVRIFDKFVTGSGTAVLALHTERKLYSE